LRPSTLSVVVRIIASPFENPVAVRAVYAGCLDFAICRGYRLAP
jgi:hypothetical protein